MTHDAVCLCLLVFRIYDLCYYFINIYPWTRFGMWGCVCVSVRLRVRVCLYASIHRIDDVDDVPPLHCVHIQCLFISVKL